MTDGGPCREAQKAETPRRRRLCANWKATEQATPLRPFIDYAWENFDPRAIASYLLDSGPSHFHRHKAILHAGFCAWVICPGFRKLREDAMVYSVARAIEAAEAPWREKASGFNRLVGDVVGLTLGTDRRFNDEVFYPIGGAPRILRAMSRPTFKRTLLSHATEMLEAVHLVALHHYHLTHLPDKKTYHIPSKDAGAALVKTAFGAPSSRLFVEELRVKVKAGPAIKPEKDGKLPAQYKLRAETNIVKSWNASRASIAYAYAYAAASLPTEPGRTLLHEIVACRSTYTKHRDLMLEWCGRARFVVEGILDQCHPEQKPYDYGADIFSVAPVPFELPKVFSFSPEIIADGYKNARADLQEKQIKQNIDLINRYSSPS
ncbi:hypothetical protein [Methylobacterium sp. SyP6R]|uniref:hypothetical protein n=1 Tax=Methylobacterium sp. SyP6R TaxID=2718876 RepID=UPI001F3CCA5F|nr:hypothetical protein [Methylobacterium sp. SyP6R]MCF4125001.1 hypothetical protein [Methylobacterium sp. SyP6R]